MKNQQKLATKAQRHKVSQSFFSCHKDSKAQRFTKFFNPEYSGVFLCVFVPWWRISCFFVSLCLCGSFFSSCKYDDGPKISLATKKGRAANVWKIERSFTNGTENPCDQACKNERDKFIIVLTKDGNVMVKGELFDQSYESFGKWLFNSDKTKIGIKMECQADFVYYKILRLKSKELWTEYTDPVTKEKYETHRIPA